MSMTMPVWRKDIKTLQAAWRLRTSIRHQEFTPSALPVIRVRHGQTPYRNLQRRVIGGSLLLVSSMFLTVSTFAVEAGQVMYTRETVIVAQDTIGTLDIRVPSALVFKFTATNSGSGEIDIAYDKIAGFAYRTVVAHHIGALPATSVSPVKRRERKHYFTIDFNDSSGVAQVAIFEDPKQDPPALFATLRSRSPHACKPATCTELIGLSENEPNTYRTEPGKRYADCT